MKLVFVRTLMAPINQVGFNHTDRYFRSHYTVKTYLFYYLSGKKSEVLYLMPGKGSWYSLKLLFGLKKCDSCRCATENPLHSQFLPLWNALLCWKSEWFCCFDVKRWRFYLTYLPSITVFELNMIIFYLPNPFSRSLFTNVLVLISLPLFFPPHFLSFCSLF